MTKQNQSFENAMQHELLIAIDTGNTSRVSELLEAGAGVNWPTSDPDGETPLIRAITAGHPDVVQALLKFGADANLRQRGRKSWTPLMFAHADAAATRDLIAAGADVNARTPAHKIPVTGQTPQRAVGGETALHFAAAANNPAVVRLLIEGGAEVEARAENGSAPLDFALALGRTTEVASLLVEAGAKLTPQRIEQMHADAHSLDSDLFAFPWAEREKGEKCGASEVETARFRRGQCSPQNVPQQSLTENTEAKCPKCDALLYSRKAKACGNCGAEIWTPPHAEETLADGRQWARDLANAFSKGKTNVSPGVNSSSSVDNNPSTSRVAPEILLRNTSSEERFRRRSRPDFWLYLAGYTLLSVCVVTILGPATQNPAVACVVGLAFVLACYRSWSCASPLCSNCGQNIKVCRAAYCHVCGAPLLRGRCNKCAVSSSWATLFLPYAYGGNIRWIAYCPACGVWLNSRIRRWRAGH